MLTKNRHVSWECDGALWERKARSPNGARQGRDTPTRAPRSSQPSHAAALRSARCQDAAGDVAGALALWHEVGAGPRERLGHL